jgi:hypothetical protein
MVKIFREETVVSATRVPADASVDPIAARSLGKGDEM